MPQETFHRKGLSYPVRSYIVKNEISPAEKNLLIAAQGLISFDEKSPAALIADAMERA